MGETDEGSSSGSRRSSKEVEKNLLHTFMAKVKEEDSDDGDDVQLNLGLSLGGRFGVDKSHARLTRSSSAANVIPLIRDVAVDDDGNDHVGSLPTWPVVGTAAPAAVLPRTASLPLETEEEWRKRKELQTLRRMEAKKRRSEKRNSCKESGEGRGNEVGLSLKLERDQQHCARAANKIRNSASLSHWAPADCSAMKSEVVEGVDDEMKGKRSFFSSLQGLLAQQVSPCSGKSQVGSSSCASEHDSRRTQGTSAEARTPARMTSDIRCRTYGPVVDDTMKQAGTGETNMRREMSTGVGDMPNVFTIGDGPNGRKVDGILYMYGKGEEVRIMCVCHGEFFTPAEFIKHAGGRDVEHPLRRIIVNPSGSAFL